MLQRCVCVHFYDVVGGIAYYFAACSVRTSWLVPFRVAALSYKYNGVFTRSSKRTAIHAYFEYICWKFAGRLLDRVNTL